MLAESFLRSGKVRDLYMLNDGRLLLVASDRISAFDVVLPSMIPDKGRVLTGLSRFWFAETAGIVPNHLLDTDPTVFADYVADDIRSKGYPPADVGPLDVLRGRMMICRPATVVPIEAVVRGYLAGSGWKEYQASGTVCGIPLPPGLRESDRLPGADLHAGDQGGGGRARREHQLRPDGRAHRRRGARRTGLRRPAGRGDPRSGAAALRLRVGRGRAARHPARRHEVRVRPGQAWGPGSIGSSTFHDDDPADPLDRLILIDEALTPDSSRFWDAATYEPGRPQASFDKQFVRDWLEAQPWDKTDPGPALPDEVIEGTRARYVEAYERITGASFERYLREDVIAP